MSITFIPQSTIKLISNSPSKSTTLKKNPSKVNKNYIDYGEKSMLEKANIKKNNNKLLKDRMIKHSLNNKSSVFEFYNNFLNRTKSIGRMNNCLSVLNLKKEERKEVPFMKYLKESTLKKKFLFNKALINKSHTDDVKDKNDFILNTHDDYIDNNIKKKVFVHSHMSLNKYYKSNKSKTNNTPSIQMLNTNLTSSQSQSNCKGVLDSTSQNNKILFFSNKDSNNNSKVSSKSIHRNIFNINSSSFNNNNLDNIDILQYSHNTNMTLSYNHKTYSTNYFYEFPLPKLKSSFEGKLNDSNILYMKKPHRFRNTLYFRSKK